MDSLPDKELQQQEKISDVRENDSGSESPNDDTKTVIQSNGHHGDDLAVQATSMENDGKSNGEIQDKEIEMSADGQNGKILDENNMADKGENIADESKTMDDIHESGDEKKRGDNLDEISNGIEAEADNLDGQINDENGNFHEISEKLLVVNTKLISDAEEESEKLEGNITETNISAEKTENGVGNGLKETETDIELYISEDSIAGVKLESDQKDDNVGIIDDTGAKTDIESSIDTEAKISSETSVNTEAKIGPGNSEENDTEGGEDKIPAGDSQIEKLEENDELKNIVKTIGSESEKQDDGEKSIASEGSNVVTGEIDVSDAKSTEDGNVDDEDDRSSATDTSNLANIIVKHVLDTAVSSFKNDTSDDENDELVPSMAINEDYVEPVSNIDKRSHEQDDKVADDSQITESKLTEVQKECQHSGEVAMAKGQSEDLQSEETTDGNQIEFDENGNRRGSQEPQYNPVAMEIAVSMVTDKKEAEVTKVTDQIREDIEMISEYISLNDTVETEQNTSKQVEHEKEFLQSENDIVSLEKHVQSTKYEQEEEKSPDSPCGSQGLPTLAPLPNYPEFPINYGNYKVCRNVSPSEKECLIIETGEILTSKDKSNKPGFKSEGGQGEMSKESSLYDRSSTPQNILTDSRDQIGLESKMKTENSFKILKNSYSPISSPRSDSKENGYHGDNLSGQPNVPGDICYSHVPSSMHSEISNSQRDRNNLYKNEDSDSINRQSRSKNEQKLNNERDLRRNNEQDLRRNHSNNIYETMGDIDLSDPSVMVRYQRNILSQNQQANSTNASIPSYSEQSYNTQSTVPTSQLETDASLLSNLSIKYGLLPQHSRSLNNDQSTVSTPPGLVPSYRTLQEQQNTWMEMFKTLEEKHQLDLQQQSRLHKENLFNLQQHMEDELIDQQKSFRQKLTMHKEALSQSLNYSPSPIHDDQHKMYSSMNESYISRTTDDLTHSKDGTMSYQETFQTHDSLLRNRSPSWREIYKEIRGADASDEEKSPREQVRRSLDKNLAQSDERSRTPIEGEDRKERNNRRQSLSPRERPSRSDRPRAGVYSSPMPISRGKVINTQPESQLQQITPRKEDRNVNTCDRVMSPTLSERKQSSSLQRLLESQHQERLLQQSQRDEELAGDSLTSDDVYLSASTRVSLREKHAKHMADLREYYEKELHDLRSSLLSNVSEQSPWKQVTSENQNLVIENRLLREKIQDTEKDFTNLVRKNRELEQLNHGLEIRAKEYAENFNESQAKLANFRNKMEELQFYFREKDETAQLLEYQVKHVNEKLRTAKKTNQELNDQIQRERGVLKKVSEKVDNADRDQQMLKDALNSTENKLYDARTEIVELKRTISKLELENKRLCRENDNLHNRRIQPANTSSLHNSFHDSFESPSSPRRDNSVVKSPTLPSEDRSEDSRLNCSSEDRSILNSSRSPSRRNTEDTSQHYRETTPDKSPVLRAEQDLYRLRDMMQKLTQSPAEPPKLKLKKKFYGSEMQTQGRRDEYSYDSSPKRSSLNSSPKTRLSKPRRSQENNSVTNGDSPNKIPKSSSKLKVNSDKYPSQTNFEISAEIKKSKECSRNQRYEDEESRTRDDRPSKQKLRNGQSPEVKSSPRQKKVLNGTHDPERKSRNEVENTLNKVRSGEYVSRPEWEDLYTSMTKPPENQTHVHQPREDKIRERISSIADLEHQYDDLNLQKTKLESALSRVPLHGKGRLEKERVEDKLDQVERELGSIRMTLKRYNVLKTSI